MLIWKSLRPRSARISGISTDTTWRSIIDTIWKIIVTATAHQAAGAR
jgi:hypothetical protein